MIGTKICGVDPRVVPMKFFDADDRQRLAVDDDCVVENIRVGAEARLPPPITEHADSRLPDRAIVVWSEEAADHRLDPEDGEVAARDEDAIAAERLSSIRQVGAEEPVCRDAGKRGLHALEVAEHRIAQHDVTVARLVAGLAAWLRAGRRQVHQPIGFLHRQRPQDELVELRKDGRVGAYAEPERDDGHDRDEGAFEEAPKRELEVRHVVSRTELVTLGFGAR